MSQSPQISGAIEELIAARLKPRPFPGQSGLTAFLAAPGERVSDLARSQTPYWAYCWAGGAALVRYLEAHPEVVLGKSVLDYGAGSGRVGLAAAHLGAARLCFIDRDPVARAAISLNCRLNSIQPNGIAESDSAELLDQVDIVLAGDVFYGAAAARQSLAFLKMVQAAGKPVLVGDPGRKYLPKAWTALAHYQVPDFGSPETVESAVYKP